MILDSHQHFWQVGRFDYPWMRRAVEVLYVDQALEYFGPQRMMFGSDWPVCLLAASYDRVLDAAQSLLADLGDEDRNRIFSKKAAEFYGIQSQTALSCL